MKTEVSGDQTNPTRQLKQPEPEDKVEVASIYEDEESKDANEKETIDN